MTERRVLITTPWLASGCAAEVALRAAGFQVDYAPSLATAPDPHTIDAIIVGTEPVEAAAIARATRLRVIVRTGVGYDNVDLPQSQAQGVAVCTTPGANRMSVAELVLGMIFDCARNISDNVASVRRGEWDRGSGIEIAGSVLGIVGLGSIGKAVAALAQSVGMKVIATDPHHDASVGVDYRPLDSLLREADFVTLHVALTPETRDLINAESLGIMKPTAYLINTSRGGVIDEQALADAVRDGEIAGAALDVLNREPLHPDDPLAGVEGVRITAHIAGATVQSRERSAESAAAQIIGYFEGEAPIGLVTPVPALETSAPDQPTLGSVR
jgi:D-3-phosphoglycerate dehydrogenase/(S)-sulfolactate dehydrogenase